MIFGSWLKVSKFQVIILSEANTSPTFRNDFKLSNLFAMFPKVFWIACIHKFHVLRNRKHVIPQLSDFEKNYYNISYKMNFQPNGVNNWLLN